MSTNYSATSWAALYYVPVAHLSVWICCIPRLHDESFEILSLFGLDADLDRLPRPNRSL